MPVLYGNKYTKKELLERVGDISQIGGVKTLRLTGGRLEGVEAVEFKTGSGLCFTAVPGRSLDITSASYKGKALGWLTPAGEVHSAYYEEPGLGWLRSFPGGLVTTCGLTYVGAPCNYDGQALGLHGRISNTPASNVYADGKWDGDEYKMSVSGKMREFSLFSENLLLERKISAMLGQNKIFIKDTVTNESPRTTPHMILYHINAGFPVVDTESVLVSHSINVTPRDSGAKEGKESFNKMQPPTEGFTEKCYYHEMACDKDGFVYVAIINKSLADCDAFGFYVKYNKNELPKFTQWKMNGIGEYVTGIEPANCLVTGRDKDRESGILQYLKAGEIRNYHIEIGVISSLDEANEIEEKIKSING